MTTALVPVSDLERMAQAFAKSALFGAKSPEQCMALLLLAQGEGLHPAIAMRDFDVIQGKPAKKAEAMLRSFLAAGGSVEWHEMTDTKADASFSHPQGSNGKPVRISWDMERAKKAGLAGKDNWQKYSRAMLANRVISEGCRRVYPAATSGLYEPGEVRDIARQDKRAEKDMGKAEVIPDEDITLGMPEGSAAPQVSSSQAGATASAPAPAEAADSPYISADQALQLVEDLQGIPDGERRLKRAAGVERLTLIKKGDLARAQQWVENARGKK